MIVLNAGQNGDGYNDRGKIVINKMATDKTAKQEQHKVDQIYNKTDKMTTVAKFQGSLFYFIF